MRSIELVFDDSTDSLVRADWTRLEAAGLPSLAAHTSPSNSPHITLAAGVDLQAGGEGPWQALPIDIAFSGAVVFPAGTGKYVLARSVLLTAPLLDLHRHLHQGLSGALPLTLPGAWTPHVTIARRLPGHQPGAAMDLLDLRIEGRCTAARLWDSSTKAVTLLGGLPERQT
ncbi:2'-5' RNA ligase family protein [Arthrobacter sp. ISL-85]|uniref:2'-5' RNA ligase family protein n=1 Tax=Arthrobacter sp. ISL-85 TaxID=2819115 RepID=UPI001BED200C|nr:2'-5' RNA ligase family protein [Arthrobacter sp. ISL-85]MBT2568044.1 2'-5' RNA ligase family protein [Arthrobacter sp. ISL-85]